MIINLEEGMSDSNKENVEVDESLQNEIAIEESQEVGENIQEENKSETEK